MVRTFKEADDSDDAREHEHRVVNRFGTLESARLGKLALLYHHVYQSYDYAFRVLKELDARHRVQASTRYLER